MLSQPDFIHNVYMYNHFVSFCLLEGGGGGGQDALVVMPLHQVNASPHSYAFAAIFYTQCLHNVNFFCLFEGGGWQDAPVVIPLHHQVNARDFL